MDENDIFTDIRFEKPGLGVDWLICEGKISRIASGTAIPVVLVMSVATTTAVPLADINIGGAVCPLDGFFKTIEKLYS